MESLKTINNGLRTKPEQEAFNQLPEGLKEFTLVRLEKCVKDLTDFDLKDACLDIIGVAYVEQAQMDIHPNVRAFQAETLFGELRKIKDFKLLTLSEVRLAFKMGVRKEFDTDTVRGYGMCAATYNFWLKSYFNLPQRIEGYGQYLAILEAPAVVEKTPEERNEILINGIINLFKEYKDKKEKYPRIYPKISHIYYLKLEELKIMSWRKDEISEITEEGKLHLKRLQSENKIKGSDFVEGFFGNHDFDSACNIVAIKIYFDKCIKNKVELETVLKTFI
jgi:hypothetical protein